MFTVVLVRPGCTDFDDQNRIQGTLDLPLNSSGESQVEQTIDELQSVPFELIYTAPCDPARGSAARIGKALGIPVKELEGLKNLNQGLWQGLQVGDIRRKHPKVFKQWQDSPETICPPMGEMVSDANERIRKAVEKPLKRGVSFAIVAPEPLASLIRSHITGQKFELTGCLCPSHSGQHWEILRNDAVRDSNSETSLAETHRGAHAP